MARDPQAALVALNRFGFGARGAASGDFESAVTDPRGFVRAELAKPNAALLIAPGLLSTPELGQLLFAYQKEVRRSARRRRRRKVRRSQRPTRMRLRRQTARSTAALAVISKSRSDGGCLRPTP